MADLLMDEGCMLVYWFVIFFYNTFSVFIFLDFYRILHSNKIIIILGTKNES